MAADVATVWRENADAPQQTPTCSVTSACTCRAGQSDVRRQRLLRDVEAVWTNWDNRRLEKKTIDVYFGNGGTRAIAPPTSAVWPWAFYLGNYRLLVAAVRHGVAERGPAETVA